jgi:hypothetical protein
LPDDAIPSMPPDRPPILTAPPGNQPPARQCPCRRQHMTS